MKRPISLVLVLILMLTVCLTACDSPSEPAESGGSAVGEISASDSQVKQFVSYLLDNAYADAIVQYNTKIAGNARSYDAANDEKAFPLRGRGTAVGGG